MNRPDARQVTVEEMDGQDLPDGGADFYRSLFWNLSAIIIVFDPDTTHILDVTRTACQFYGYSREELLKLRIADLTLVESGRMREYIQQVVAGEHQALYLQHRLASGAVRDLEVLPERTRWGNQQAVAAVIHDVTERLKAECAYREHLEKFNVIFNHLPMTAVTFRLVLNPAGEVVDATIEDANLNAAGSLGGDPEQLRGQLASRAWPPALVASLLEMSQEVCGKDAAARREIFLAEGQRWYELVVAGISPDLFVLAAIDTTQRVLAEKILENQERELRSLLDDIPGQVSIMLPDGSFDYFNRAFLNYVRLPLEQLVGDGWRKTVHPEDLLLLKKAWKEAAQTPRLFEMELRIRGADWNYRWFLCRAVPKVKADGQISKWLILDVDITERKQADEAVRAIEENSQLLYRASSDAILTSDSDGMIQWANFAGSRLFGWTEAELQARRLADIFDDQGRKLQEVLDALREQGTYSGELIGLRRDGTRFDVEMNASTYLDAAGAFRSGIFIRDISIRKAMEENLADHIEELKTNAGELQHLVDSLDKSRREADLLRQMGEQLQICLDEEEAYATIRQFGLQLFPGAGCGLYLAGAATRQVETALIWGPELSSDAVFGFDACWALRRGRLFQVNQARDLKCAHMLAGFSGSYLDIPLTAEGEVLGLLHLEWDDAPNGALEHRDVAITLADNAALSLANLRLRQKLQLQSIRDPLTGAVNRRYLDEVLAQRLPGVLSGKVKPISLAMLDIDHFKEINEQSGHLAADGLLVQLTELLRAQLRAEDLVCRYSGDVFLLLLTAASCEVARERAEAIRSLTARQIFLNGGRSIGRVTVSVGVATCPDHAFSADELIRAADRALNLAKQNGRDQVAAATAGAAA